jgi:type IV pilus assembly protein PilM
MFDQYKVEPIWQNKEMVGFDIGTKYIKVVQLKKSKKLTKLVGYGQYQVPDNYIIEGIITEPEKLAKELKTFLKSGVWGEINAERVVTSLPESKIFTRSISLPKMPESELAQAVNWEASQTIPMALSDLYLDFQVIGPSEGDPKNDDIIYAAAPKAIVNSYIQLFNELDMELANIETSLAAIARAMIPTKESDAVTMVIDIGGVTTNLAVFDHVIRVTGSTLVGAISLDEKIKLAVGKSTTDLESKNKIDEKIKAQIREAIDYEVTEITREASRMVSYYSERGGDKKVTKVLICGGGANIPSLTDIIEEKLTIKTVIGNPWENISIYPIKPIPKNEASAYTNAVGLALLGDIND